MQKIGAVVLAAGKSTRLKSAIPKVLHSVCGKPLVVHTVNAVLEADKVSKIAVVISSEFKSEFESTFSGKNGITFSVQKKQKGTADAVLAAKNALLNSCEYVLIIPGDVPLIRPETLKKFIDATIAHDVVGGVLSMEPLDSAAYGRVVRSADGRLKAIVEAKDASPEELLIREVNGGVYCVKCRWLFNALEKIAPDNAQKEYYLTDIVKIAVSEGVKMIVARADDPDELLGVNTRKELAEASRLKQIRILEKLMKDGVGILDINNTYIDDGVIIGADTVISPNCSIRGGTKIGKSCFIDNGVIIKNSVIGDEVIIKPYSVIDESSIGDCCHVGPFARLRPGAVIESEAKIGNFVEIKKSIIKKGAKANHLSYIGDAVVGLRTNIGCGTITCNYDGQKKHQTVIGNDVFVGSDVQFVAPVKIGSGALIGAGSTITENVPANSLAIARGKQVIKRGWAKKRG
ncbi:MAG: bifunctional UDP-N-acetylglucosamine diphosphorylase/glucosamine-1-phosphate N-acetyltransferase GlmU [Deltaproteobacteria bacterium]|nr:bifunctional UDP-N-acetylglucosamine diphosphorylase/glucosamine-1-phosphate N-acetyltransferase GlmU [Deltaproteobacteria bacterium]